MQNKIYLVTRADGGVTILRTTHECTEEYLQRDLSRIEGYVSHKEIDESDIPEDRTFRDAWKEDTTKAKRVITHDLDKARAIVREVRNKKLEELDKKAYSAERKKDAIEIAAIEELAQSLRDIPQDPDFSTSDIKKLKKLLEKAK